MAESVYIETTVVSYLTAWRSRDLVRAAQQQITREWWDQQRPKFNLFVSQIVMIEVASGDSVAAEERLKELQGIPILGISEQALDLADELIVAAALPARAARDAQHVGIAAVNGLDYLLTWNCRHLANVALRDRIEEVCERFDVRAPKICTPEELQGAINDG